MKKYILLFLSAFAYCSLFGQTTFTTAADGDWNNCATWGTCPGAVEGVDWPGTGDIAIGDALYILTVSANQTCSLLTTNGDDNFNSGLIVNSGVTLTVENEWEINSVANGGELNINLNGAVNVADDLDMNITNSDYVVVFEIATTGALNLNDVTVTNTAFITGTNADITFNVFGPLTIADRMVLRATNGADITIDANANITLSNDDLQLETQGAGSTVTLDLDAVLTCADRLILQSDAASGSASVSIDMVTGGTVNLDGILDLLGLGGGGTIDASATASTFEYGGAGAQTIQMGPTLEYHHLLLSGAGTKTLEAAITNANVIGNITTQAGTFNSNGNDITLGGNWSNSGTFTQGTNKLTMNGGAAQTIGGSSTTKFFDLEIANTMGGVSLTAATQLEGTLTLVSGVFTTGANFTLTSDASRTGRVGLVSGGSMAGDLTIERRIAAIPNWRILASPVGGSSVDIADWGAEISLSCITGASHTTPHFTNVYTYDETVGGTHDNGYSSDDDPGPSGVTTSDILGSGNSVTGYMMWIGTCVPPCAATAITTDLTGTLITGTQTISCTFTASAGDDHDGWNMIGNPFPSDFSWDAASAAKTGGVTDIIYVYDPATNDYLSLDAGLCCDRDIVPSMQGFFAKCSGSGGNIVIAEVDKVADANNFLKTGSDPPRLALSLTGNSYTDEVSFYFMAGATENYDPQLDALNPYSLTWDFANFSIMSPDSHELEYNKLPGFDQDYSFPLRINWIWPGTDTTFTISADDFSMVPTSVCLTLEDTVLGIFTDLRTNSYTFNMTPDTNVAPRFMLHVGAQISKTRMIPTCKGASDGMAIAGGQGTGPWNYLWLNSGGDTTQYSSNVNSTDTLSNVPADTYTISIANSGGFCATAVDTFILSEPATDVSTTTQMVNASCFGDSVGSIDLEVAGGIPPYAYVWSNTDTTQDIGNLTAGNYSVSITDANGCLKLATATITEPTDLLIFSSAADITCNGDNDGAIDLTVTGGTQPYNYTWSSGPSTQDVTGLAPGSYTVNIVDTNNCAVSDSFNLTEPALVAAIFTAAADTVYLFEGGDLQFTNNSTGATSFEWDFNDGSPLSTVMSPMHVFSAVGTYNVSMVASNINNCADTSYKSTAVLDSFLVGIGPITDDLASNVNYITNGAGLFVEFAFRELTQVNIRVYNLIGQEVSSFDKVTVHQNRLKVLDPQKVMGTYFIKVETEIGSTIGKVIY